MKLTQPQKQALVILAIFPKTCTIQSVVAQSLLKKGLVFQSIDLTREGHTIAMQLLNNGGYEADPDLWTGTQ